jgi:predicted RNase H-like nuclease (RuvC/YqgF family)
VTIGNAYGPCGEDHDFLHSETCEERRTCARCHTPNPDYVAPMKSRERELEDEVQSLREEVRTLTAEKSQLERQIERLESEIDQLHDDIHSDQYQGW